MTHTSADRPIVLVTGATGAQGGSVARALLATDAWTVRVLTRTPTSPAARALAAAGARVCQGDLADRASLDRALDGAQAAFATTAYWEHLAREYSLGITLLEALVASRVRHVVMSTQPSPQRLSRGETPVPQYDIKALLQDEARALGLPATFVHVAFTYESFLGFAAPVRTSNGQFALALPMGQVPLAAVSVDDVGGVVAQLLARPREFMGRVVPIVGDERPVPEYAARMAWTLGHPVTYAHVTREDYAASGVPAAEDLASCFDYHRRFVPSRREAIMECRALHPDLQDFGTWMGRHAAEFSRRMAA